MSTDNGLRTGLTNGPIARADEMAELLRSACAIAERRGEGTAWDRFIASVHKLGLNGVTARTYRVLPSDLEGGEQPAAPAVPSLWHSSAPGNRNAGGQHVERPAAATPTHGVVLLDGAVVCCEERDREPCPHRPERRCAACPGNAEQPAEQAAVPLAIDYAALVTDALTLHKYRPGTTACVAFKHGAEWQAKRTTRPDEPVARVLVETQAARDVLAERRRQIEVEGWTPEHDDEHNHGELALAASCYAEQGPEPYGVDYPAIPVRWPWDADWWRPRDYRRNLVKAGALILAEIERLDRAAKAAGTAT